jgi:phosphoribosyl-ATP pyrophosphohydrolase
MDEIFNKLEKIIESRKSSSINESYVANLQSKGLDQILKKIAEESAEVIMAAKEDDKDKIMNEVADLFFHTLVLLNFTNIKVDEINKKLSSRLGLSGLKEKYNRNKIGGIK